MQSTARLAFCLVHRVVSGKDIPLKGRVQKWRCHTKICKVKERVRYFGTVGENGSTRIMYVRTDSNVGYTATLLLRQTHSGASRGQQDNTAQYLNDRLSDKLLAARKALLRPPPYPPVSASFLLSQIDLCLLGNLQNPLVGTVHIFTDHPEALRKNETSAAITSLLGGGASASWAETAWRPPVLKGLDNKVAGAKC